MHGALIDRSARPDHFDMTGGPRSVGLQIVLETSLDLVEGLQAKSVKVSAHNDPDPPSPFLHIIQIICWHSVVCRAILQTLSAHALRFTAFPVVNPTRSAVPHVANLKRPIRLISGLTGSVDPRLPCPLCLCRSTCNSAP